MTPPPPPPFQGLDPALVYYRVLPRKREFIPRGTQKHKSNAFPFTRTVQTVQIANSASPRYIYVVVNFSSQVIFVFLLFWGMVMYANEVETKEK